MLLRALTGARVPECRGGYVFTTVNPVVGVVRVALDGSFVGGEDGGVFDETSVERQRTWKAASTPIHYGILRTGRPGTNNACSMKSRRSTSQG